MTKPMDLELTQMAEFLADGGAIEAVEGKTFEAYKLYYQAWQHMQLAYDRAYTLEGLCYTSKEVWHYWQAAETLRVWTIQLECMITEPPMAVPMVSAIQDMRYTIWTQAHTILCALLAADTLVMAIEPSLALYAFGVATLAVLVGLVYINQDNK